MTPSDILVIEDDRVLGGAIAQRLRLEGFTVRWTQTCASAMKALRDARPDLVLADIRLPDGSGEELYRQALPYLGDTPIVFATAFAEVEQAVRLVRAGADDYLTKPYDVDALIERVRTLAAPRERADSEIAEPFGLSEATRPLAADLARVAERDLPVLLRGETGVGKEVAARFIHRRSARASGPFVAVNCGAVARELMESQFFGHERGAFTGAHAAHAGFFEEAARGTLFLDEIGELDPRLQTALLRVLEDGTFRRLGGSRDLRFEGRIIAATNADLDERIAARELREDLYFRLAVVEITLPPLRERPGEIDALARILLARGVAELETGGASAPERAVALAAGDRIEPHDLFPERRLDAPSPRSLADAREQAELDEIERALLLSRGRVGDAAKRLGISRTTLWKRRRKSE